jgi:hypothetical protein
LASHPHPRRRHRTDELTRLVTHIAANEASTQVGNEGDTTNDDTNEVNAVRHCPHCRF